MVPGKGSASGAGAVLLAAGMPDPAQKEVSI